MDPLSSLIIAGLIAIGGICMMVYISLSLRKSRRRLEEIERTL
jgi:uncharacterized protein YoxC